MHVWCVAAGEVAGLRVLKYPHPSLRAHNEEVTVFDTELQDLAKNMFKVSVLQTPSIQKRWSALAAFKHFMHAVLVLYQG
jgi:hypothetical protein